MATKVWNGSSDSFSNAAAWSPVGVPVSGDTAVINAGTVASPIVTNAIYNSDVLTLSIGGAATLTGAGNFARSAITVAIAPGAMLVNTGTMTFDVSTLVATGGGTLENDGTIALTNANATATSTMVADPVTGTGQFTLGQNTGLEMSAAVGSGQTIAMTGGSGGRETLQLDALSSFSATVSGFSATDLIAVINTPYTAATYTNTGATTGTLNLYSGTTLGGGINFSGAYQLSDFTFTFNDFGGGNSNLQIGTTGASGTTGSGGSGGTTGTGAGGTGPGGTGSTGSGSTGTGSTGTGSTGTGNTGTGTTGTGSTGVDTGTTGMGTTGGTTTGSGTAVAAVYRFFDTNYGTHFFTSDIGERNTVLATRPDLVQETNGFGDVAPSDPNAVAVYRFFDKNYGTHFFTGNASERDTVIATRPDLAYEPNSTFYEHVTFQTGDVAVYRLFDQKTGTQFLTGDQGEYNGIVTAGASTYRPDLRSEGVAFYAPVGTFK